MKDNRLDDLFRNGLESYKITPPQNAWAQIEEGLPKNKKKGAYFWFSIAASIMLLATIGWLAFSNSDISQNAAQEVLSENNSEVNETIASQPEDKVDLNNSPLAQENQAPIELIEALESQTDNMPALVAGNEALDTEQLTESIISASNSWIDESFELKVQPIHPKLLARSPFLVTNYASFKLSLNSDMLMQNVIVSPQELEAMEDGQKKKFGFLHSIVSVAKGVNNGSKAIAEIRKSKNEFITNDLKYGQKTDEDVEKVDDSPSKQD